MLKRTLAFFLIISFFPPITMADANWFSDQYSTAHTSPSHFETQQRGYFSGGSLSVRQPAGKKESFISVQPPKFSAGCGGIDAFWGGMSYLNPEFLVESFQKILQNAPALAFKMGLKVLCEQCDDAMTSLEKLAKQINSLGLDDCQASQALVNFGGDLLTDMGVMGESQGTSADDTWLVEKINMMTDSVADWQGKLNEYLNYKYCGGLNGNALSRCKTILHPEGSFWAKMYAVDKGGPGTAEDSDLKDLYGVFSGLFGDITIHPPGGSGDGNEANTIKMEYIDSCYAMEGGATEQAGQGVNRSLKGIIEYMLDPDFDDSSADPVIYARQFSRSQNSEGIWVYSSGGCVEKDLPPGWSVGKEIRENMEDLISMMGDPANNDLESDSDIMNFIQKTTLPIYQIINTYSLRGARGGVSSDLVISEEEKQALIRLATVGHIQYLLNGAFSKARNMVRIYHLDVLDTTLKSQNFETQMDHMNDAIKEANEVMQVVYKDTLEDFQRIRTQIIAWQQEQRELQAMLRPRGLIGAYNFK